MRDSGVALAFAKAGFGGAGSPPVDDWQPPTEYPDGADGEPLIEVDTGSRHEPIFTPITPAVWKGTDPVKQRWLAGDRVPSGDLTILAGNGGSGKTEIATGLLVSVAAGLGDWLGCVVESGPA